MRDLLVEGSHCMLGQVQSPTFFLSHIAVPDKLLLTVNLHHVVSPKDGEKLLISHIVKRHPLACSVKVLLQSNIGVVLVIPNTKHTTSIEDIVSLSEALVVLTLRLITSGELTVH